MASSSEKSAAKANLLGKRGPQDDLETKPFLRKHKGQSEEKEVAVRKKTLYFGNFALETEISDIINFFETVEGVVRVQLLVSPTTNEHMGCGFVEFASSYEAKKALQNKNGEDFRDCEILLDVDSMGAAKFPPMFCVDHKFFWDEDHLPQENLLIEEDETIEETVEETTSREKTLFVSNLSPQSELPDIINFLNYYGGLVSVRLIVNQKGKHVGYGFAEFSSDNTALKALTKTNGRYLHDHNVYLALATGIKDNLAEMFWYEDRLRGEILPFKEDEAPPYNIVEKVDVRNKMLFVGNLSPQTEISHIINFFKDVGEVVHVRLFVGLQCKHVGYGFVKFASTNESNKALDHMYGKYLHGRKIFLDLAKNNPDPPHLMYLEYLRRESLPIEQEESMKRHVEEVARRGNSLCIRNLSLRTKKSDIINFFKDVEEVVHVHLNQVRWDMDVRSGIVEFASSTEAKKALDKKKGQDLLGYNIHLSVYKKNNYHLRPLCIDHKVWYEDYLRQKNLLIEEDDEDETIEGLVEEVARRKKTLFVTKLPRTRISYIIRFFEDVGKVVGVRLSVDHMGELVGCGFVEFASVNEAKKALQKKYGMNLCSGRVYLKVAKIAPYPLQPKYNRAEKLWSMVESCLMREDDLETKHKLKKQKEKVIKADDLSIFCGKKTTFSDDDS